MQKVTLQFPSLIQLVSFQSVAKAASFRITITDLSIIGTFSEVDIALAREGYQASLIAAEPVGA
jgi:hypothetical protein